MPDLYATDTVRAQYHGETSKVGVVANVWVNGVDQEAKGPMDVCVCGGAKPQRGSDGSVPWDRDPQWGPWKLEEGKSTVVSCWPTR